MPQPKWRADSKQGYPHNKLELRVDQSRSAKDFPQNTQWHFNWHSYLWCLLHGLHFKQQFLNLLKCIFCSIFVHENVHRNRCPHPKKVTVQILMVWSVNSCRKVRFWYTPGTQKYYFDDRKQTRVQFFKMWSNRSSNYLRLSNSNKNKATHRLWW